ncbi:MAG: hypothetical protein D6785_03920 [Planctomycetota bacterium]|nr:MAG: hypothetical protein D6785_03920 [Planctomycetota bacterium]
MIHKKFLRFAYFNHFSYFWLVFFYLLSFQAFSQSKAENTQITLLVTHSLRSNTLQMSKVYQYCKTKYPKGSFLLIDTGDPWDSHHFYDHFSQGKFSLDLMNLMGYHIASPSHEFLGQHWKEWDSLLKPSRFPWILSNLLRNGSYLFPPYWIFQKGSKRIAFLSIASPQYFKNPFFKKLFQNTQIETPEKVLEKFLPSLFKQCDFIILVSQCSPVNNIFCASKFRNISLILGRERHRTQSYFQKIGSTHILWQAGKIPSFTEIHLIFKDGLPPQVQFRFISLKKLPPSKEFLKTVELKKKIFDKKGWNTNLDHLFQKKISLKEARKFLSYLFCKNIQKETEADLVLLHLPSFQNEWSQLSSLSLKKLWQTFPLPNQAFEILLTGKGIRKIYQAKITEDLYCFGLKIKWNPKTKQKEFLINGQLLQDQKAYHIVCVLDNQNILFSNFPMKKIVKIIERDFFNPFVKDLKKQKYFNKIRSKGGNSQ